MTHDPDQTVDAEVEDLDMVFMRAVALALPAYELYNGRESAAIPDVAVVAVAFLREALAPPTRPALNKCSWCVQAAGDTEEAWQAARSYSIEEVRAHALTCAHNPAVKHVCVIAADRVEAERERDEARAAIAARDLAIEAFTTRVSELLQRRDRLLELVANISQTTPLAEELQGWESQRAALVAEVGTLRARIAEAGRERVDRVDVQGGGLPAMAPARLSLDPVHVEVLRRMHADEQLTLRVGAVYRSTTRHERIAALEAVLGEEATRPTPEDIGPHEFAGDGFDCARCGEVKP